MCKSKIDWQKEACLVSRNIRFCILSSIGFFGIALLYWKAIKAWSYEGFLYSLLLYVCVSTLTTLWKEKYTRYNYISLRKSRIQNCNLHTTLDSFSCNRCFAFISLLEITLDGLLRQSSFHGKLHIEKLCWMAAKFGTTTHTTWGQVQILFDTNLTI